MTKVYRSCGRSPPAAIVGPGTIVRGGRTAVHEQARPRLRNVTAMFELATINGNSDTSTCQTIAAPSGQGAGRVSDPPMWR